GANDPSILSPSPSSAAISIHRFISSPLSYTRNASPPPIHPRKRHSCYGLCAQVDGCRLTCSTIQRALEILSSKHSHLSNHRIRAQDDANTIAAPNGSPTQRLYPAAVLDFAHIPQLFLKASLSNFPAFASDCIFWRVTRSADNTFVPMIYQSGSELACFSGVSLEQASDPVPPTFASDMGTLEAPEIAYLRITKPDEKKRGTKYSLPPGRAF
ncbi:unnamed protein product, partial [Fusarium fujikuroi]